MTTAEPPATRSEVRSLEWRLRLEVGLTNLLGIAVIVLAFFLLEPVGRDELEDIPLVFVTVFVASLYVVGFLAGHRLFLPLERWLREGRAGEPAPERIRRLALAHPALQALMLLAFWWGTGLMLAALHVGQGPERPVQAFFSTFVGVAIAGLTVATLSFLTDQRILGSYLDRFFAGDDPTGYDVPSTRVGRRLFVAFALGGAVPILLIAFSVSDWFTGARDIGDIETVVWFLAAVGIGSGFLLTLSVGESITRPLRHLRAAADLVSRGDLSAAVPVEAPDELGEVAVAFNKMVEGLRERRRLEDLFGRQVGEAVARRALEAGVELGGERREVSVLFLDLAGFTRFAETMEPEAVVAVLNRVFAVAVREVGTREGLVNKFMGDAVLAVFGAPLDDPDHALHALRAAQAIASALDREDVDFGIGVSTGSVVAGNVGTESRYEYTVVGDAVNEAARLQELTRDAQHRVLLSGATAAAIDHHDGFVPLGEVTLRGRVSPTEIYAVP